MRYIGGKSLLLERIVSVISTEIPSVSSALDLFAGSGVVSNCFKAQGFKTIANDFLYFSYVVTRGTVALNGRPTFKELGVSDPIQYLNELTLEKTTFDFDDCFVYQNYSPVGECKRMYFHPDNALKIDIIRLTIEKWRRDELITMDEYFYLLASLINAVPFVSNITGVYAAYLKYWDERTLRPLVLIEPLVFDNGRKNECYNRDFTELLSNEYDLMYADPPYNSREYLPNYHVLETIARYDYPAIRGVTGMRNYDDQKSVFCKKKLLLRHLSR